MMKSIHERPLGEGVIPPLVTPIRKDGDFDSEGFERLVHSLLDAGVHGLFVLGTTGEGPALSQEMQRQVVRSAVESAEGRAPVYVGITDASVSELLKLADDSAEAGADALVVAPPPYSPAAGPELNHYLDHLVERLPLPMLLYTIPSRTGPVSMASILHAMSLKGCIGFKDSSANMVAMHEAILRRDERRPDFKVLVGPEELMAEALLLGADGAVAGGANLFPALFVRQFQAVEQIDLETIRRLHRVIMKLSTSLYRGGQHSSSFIKCVKQGLESRGICSGRPLWPYESFTPEDARRIDEMVKQAATLVEQALH
jgi:4-hydroxy-tetrahydrodipicolinate synthase